MNLLSGHHHHHHHHHQQHQAGQLHQLQQRQYHHYHMQVKESNQSASVGEQQHSHGPPVFQYQPSQVSSSPTSHQWYYNSMGHYAHQHAQSQQVQQYIQQADYASSGLLASQASVKGEPIEHRSNAAASLVQASQQQQAQYSSLQNHNLTSQEQQQQLEFHWMASPRRLSEPETITGGGESVWH